MQAYIAATTMRGSSAFAVAYGISSIITRRTEGSSHRALLGAVSYLALHTPESSPLLIVTSSEILARSLAYSVGQLSLEGGLCENDALHTTALLLRRRPTYTRLKVINPSHNPTQVWTAALESARAATLADAGVVAIFALPHPSSIHDSMPPFGPVLPPPSFPYHKLSTSIPPLKEESNRPPTMLGLPDDVDESSEAARANRATQTLMWANRSRLANCLSHQDFWDFVRWCRDQKRRPPAITYDAFKSECESRMNPPVQALLPSYFNLDLYSEHASYAAGLPLATADVSPSSSFSRPFSLSDITDAKARIKKRASKSSTGVDDLSYKDILKLWNDAMREFFNMCITQCAAPELWQSTIVIGILKPGKPSDRPDSYRIIALESCLAKMFTLLVDRRFREWMEEVDFLPESQNGFREGRRTNDNAFILRYAIESALIIRLLNFRQMLHRQESG
jgi:hypothetical protein